MTRRFSNVRIAACLVFSWLLFIPAVLLLGRQNLFELLNAAIMAGCIGVIVGYSREAWIAMRLPVHEVDAAQVLIVGMVVGSIGATMVFGGQWLWRALDKPDWIADSVPLAFSRWLVASGVLLILTTTKPEDGMVAAHAYRRAGAIVAAAIAIAALLIVFGLG